MCTYKHFLHQDIQVNNFFLNHGERRFKRTLGDFQSLGLIFVEFPSLSTKTGEYVTVDRGETFFCHYFE